MLKAHNLVALKTAALQTSSETKRDKPSQTWKPETARLVTLLFTRMADLFGSKCRSRGLEIYADRERRVYSETFQLWCRKLDGMSAQQMAHGMAQMEVRAGEEYQLGSEMWPPSYAEFIGLCSSHHETQAHKPFRFDRALEDKTAKEKRRELGIQQCEKLLSMFDEEPADDQTN